MKTALLNNGIGTLRNALQTLAIVFIIFLAGRDVHAVTPSPTSVAVVDLAGAEFGQGVSLIRDSSPTTITATTRYYYRIEATVHGTGNLSAAIPNGTNLADLLETLSAGSSSTLSGFYDNAGGALPFTYVNQHYDGNFAVGPFAVHAALDVLGDVLADGTVQLQVTNVALTVNSVPQSDKIVFESGSKAVVGIPPLLAFEQSAVTVSENAGSVTLNVLRTVNSLGDVEVSYETANGTATAGVDFTGGSDTLPIADGVTTGQIVIPIADNATVDGDRDFTVTLTSSALGAELQAPLTVTVTIEDDEVGIPSLVGAFSGLVHTSPGMQLSGVASVVVAKNGKFTAKVKIAGKNYTVNGKFDDGGTTPVIPVKKNSTVGLQLTLDAADADVIHGEISDGGTVTDVFDATRAVFSKTNPFFRPGKYQTGLGAQVLDVLETPADRPTGFGYLTISVNTKGAVKIKGKLADGTAVTASAKMDGNSTVPLFIPLYKKLGLIAGTLTFQDEIATNDVDGPLAWVKPENPKDKRFAAGFDTTLDAFGSIYVKPEKNMTALSFTDANIDTFDGNSGDLHTNATVSTKNKVTIASTAADSMKFSISAGSGTFKGNFKAPGEKKALPFSGVLLQKQDIGVGFFLGKPAAGTPVESGGIHFEED